MSSLVSSSFVARSFPWLAPTEVCGQLSRRTTSAIPTIGRKVRQTTWDLLSVSADILELRSWRRMSLGGAFLLAAYVAIIAQPLVYGSMGKSIVSLMTPVR